MLVNIDYEVDLHNHWAQRVAMWLHNNSEANNIALWHLSQKSGWCNCSSIGSNVGHPRRRLPISHAASVHHLHPANTKHLDNICTTSVQRLRRWSNIVQMLYKYFVFTGLQWPPCDILEVGWGRLGHHRARRGGLPRPNCGGHLIPCVCVTPSTRSLYM